MAAKRNDVTVKLDAHVADVARKAAALKGRSLADYLSAIVLPVATKDLQSEAKKLAKGDKPD